MTDSHRYSVQEACNLIAQTGVVGVTSGVSFNRGTTAQRTALGLTLTASNINTQFFDTDENRPYWWNATGWV